MTYSKLHIILQAQKTFIKNWALLHSESQSCDTDIITVTELLSQTISEIGSINAI